MFKLTYDDQFCLASFNLGFWGEGGGVWILNLPVKVKPLTPFVNL